jgi:RNA polymerase sigma-70 factor (ECF subfamily)
MSRDAGSEELDTSSRRNPAPGASEIEDSASREAVAELIAGCRAGDRDAQRRLYESFHRRIYRLLVRIVGTDAAADVTQQVFLQVFRKIEQFSGAGRFDRWLYRVAVNEAYQHLRRERQRRTQQLVYEPMDEVVRSDVRAEQKEVVEQALASLEPELRTICLLREIEELSYREIAEILDIPEGTVGSRLNRARHELKERLIRLGWEP